jgi:hypothetical protein
MSPKTKLSLLEIEQEVEAQAREWHRQQLQKRLQRVAEDQGAVCPLTGEPLQAACYEAVTLDTCAGTVTLRAHYGRHPRTRKWQHPIRLLWGLKPRQRLSPQLQDRVSYTAAETDSYERAAKMATKWGTPLAASTVHKHAQQMGREAAAQTKVREQHLMDGATQAQAIAPLPNGLEVFCPVVMMDGFMARERGPDWALKPPEAKGSRVEWHEVKAATIYRVDQVAEKASGRRQILQKFWVLAPTQTPPEEFGRAVHAEAIRAVWAKPNTSLSWLTARCGFGTSLRIASPPASRAWTFTMLPPTCGQSRMSCSPRKPKPKLGSNPCFTNSSTVKKPACSTSSKPYPRNDRPWVFP